MRVVININGDKAEVEHVTEHDVFLAFRYNGVPRVIHPVGVKAGSDGGILVMGKEISRGGLTCTREDATLKTYRAANMEDCIEQEQ
jgi:hypothetical protein